MSDTEKQIQQYICRYESPIGGIILASDGEALTGLWFERQKYFGASLGKELAAQLSESEEMEQRKLCAGESTEPEIFAETRCWLNVYFGGGIPDFTPACRLQGSPFRMEVWEILKTIPYGETMTYGEIARRIAGRESGKKEAGSRMSAQAVGGAVGHNPIGIIIPCHRVIGSDGSLTGYAGGIDKKEKLLLLEKAKFTVSQRKANAPDTIPDEEDNKGAAIL